MKGVEGAYLHATALDRRRALVGLWADYCMGAMGGDNVIALDEQRRA